MTACALVLITGPCATAAASRRARGLTDTVGREAPGYRHSARVSYSQKDSYITVRVYVLFRFSFFSCRTCSCTLGVRTHLLSLLVHLFSLLCCYCTHLTTLGRPEETDRMTSPMACRRLRMGLFSSLATLTAAGLAPTPETWIFWHSS